MLVFRTVYLLHDVMLIFFKKTDWDDQTYIKIVLLFVMKKYLVLYWFGCRFEVLALCL